MDYIDISNLQFSKKYFFGGIENENDAIIIRNLFFAHLWATGVVAGGRYCTNSVDNKIKS